MDLTILLNTVTFAFFSKPGGAASFPVLDAIFDYGRIVFLVITMVRYLLIVHRNHKISVFAVLMVIYQVLLLFPTISTQGDLFEFTKKAGEILGTIFLFEIILRDEKRLKNLHAFGAYLAFMIILNTVSVLTFYPEGFAKSITGSPQYVFSGDNRFIYTYFPAICILGTVSLIQKRKLSLWVILIYAICFGTLIGCWSVGAMVSFALFVIYYLIIYKRKTEAIFNARNYALILIALNMFMLMQGFVVFSDFIKDFLQKDITLSGRVLLWQKTIRLFLRYPVLGYGIHGLEMIRFYGSVGHPHQHFLYILYTSGVLGTIFYAGALVFSFARLYKYRHTEVAKLIAFIVFVVFFDLLADSFDGGNGLIVILMLAANVRLLIEDEGELVRKNRSNLLEYVP